MRLRPETPDITESAPDASVTPDSSEPPSPDLDSDGDGLSDLEESIPGADCMVTHSGRPDTDGDGVWDAADPFPRDPYPDFILRRAESGLIELFLSDRDGTFRDGIEIGDPLSRDGEVYAYDDFAVGDFDDNGIVDFLATTEVLPGEETLREVYFFWRTSKEDEFYQRLVGESSLVVAGVVTDANQDYQYDIARMDFTRPNYISGGEINVLVNNQHPGADCVWSWTPEEGCFFVRQAPIDIGSAVANMWSARFAPHIGQPEPDRRQLSRPGDRVVRVRRQRGDRHLHTAGDWRRFLPRSAAHADAHPAREQAPANSMLFDDFDGDGVGDLATGFDDDGQPGNLWTYFGDGAGGFDETPVDSMDLNPTDEREIGGPEFLGRAGGGRTVDLDYDNTPDLVIGYRHVNYDDRVKPDSTGATETGPSDPTFRCWVPTPAFAGRIGITTRLCPDFDLTE